LFETNRVEKDTNILKNLSKLIYKPKEAKTSDAYQKKTIPTISIKQAQYSLTLFPERDNGGQ
jgi:hypothetical protein